MEKDEINKNDKKFIDSHDFLRGKRFGYVQMWIYDERIDFYKIDGGWVIYYNFRLADHEISIDGHVFNPHDSTTCRDGKLRMKFNLIKKYIKIKQRIKNDYVIE